MKFIAAAILLFASALTPRSALSAEFYVAPDGSDAHPGTPERPLATLEGARDAARKAEGGPHRIVVMPGDYFLTETFRLDARDNGLTIEAAETGNAVLYGGTPVAEWRRDGDDFWYAELPDVKEGTRDFRALVVNGRLAERARLPETGTFTHKSTWDVRYLSNVGGGFERDPTEEELTTLFYDPDDLPDTLDINNAEVRVYHMWDEGLCGVARNDTERHALILSTPPRFPPGAFGVRQYVVLNTREGMTRPGQWYLDRTRGRLVYWPLPDEDMTQATVVAPRLETVIELAGSREERLTDITLRGLTIQATTTPLKASGFGAHAFEGALAIHWAQGGVLERLNICAVGGQGVKASEWLDGRIVDCDVHQTGAGGLRLHGLGLFVAHNRIRRVGLHYPGAIAMTAYTWRVDGANRMHIYRNEVHDAPYSGIVGGGPNFLIEENLIYRVMREMQDGAAIYGGIQDSILRGNLVRGVVQMGEGYGVSAYYLDEGARDNVVERNVAIGVERPVHNHMARNSVIRNNVFIAEGDMALSFQRSSGCTFEGNTLFIPGELRIVQPTGIAAWKENVIFRGGTAEEGAPQPFAIESDMPPIPAPRRMTHSARAVPVTEAPIIDGEIGQDEWPGELVRLDRDPSRFGAAGAPAFARLAYDERFLYVAVHVAAFDVAELRDGTTWEQDDGAELSLAGKTADGEPTVFVLRGFAGGEMKSVVEAGAPAEAAEQLGQTVRFAARPFGRTRGGWQGEWAIPFDALGITPEKGLKIPFNLAVYRSEDGVWRCWEGTLAETWQLDQAGTLELR